MPDSSAEPRVEFLRLEGAVAPSLALERLASSALEYGVILQADGSPATLAIREDLEVARQAGARSLLESRAVLPPVILAPGDITAEELAAHPVVTLLEQGARGAILIRHVEVHGVRSADWIIAALNAGHGFASGREMSRGVALADPRLGGGLTTPVGRILCHACGYPNDLHYLDPDYPPMCQNPAPPPHRLKLR